MARSCRIYRNAPLLLLLAMLEGGCYAQARTGAVVETDYVPAHVDVYPREYYDGHAVYLINDHWYYHDGARWVYYRQEPEALVRRRVVVRQAPPAAVHQRTVVRQAPPAHVHHYHEADPQRRRAERHAPRAD
jgi:hypothetical protein